MFKPIVFLSIALAANALAQAPAGPRLITVNVMVTKDKKPLKGLAKEDFVLEDKNKAQTISYFSIVENGKKPYGTLEGVIGSNRLDNTGSELGAATVIVYDRVNNEAATQARVRQEVLKVLAGLKPNDRIGFYSLGLGLTVVRDYTEEAAPLIAAAKAIQSNTPAAQLKPEEQPLHAALTQALSPIAELQNQQKVNVTFPAFQLIARMLQGAPGRRNVLWVVGAFPLTFGGSDQNRRQNDEGEIESFRQVLNNAGISLYTVNPAGSGAGFAGASLSGQQTMQLLADSTGGEAFRSGNDILQPLRDVVESTTYSYVLGFYPETSSLDDKNHNIRVTLAKKPETEKAKVLHRKDYLAWNPASTAQELQRFKTRVALKDAMEQRAIETGVGMMAVANLNPGNATVQTFDIRSDPRDVRFDSKDGKRVASLILSFATENANGTGKLLGQEELPAGEVTLTEEQWKEALEIGGIDIRRHIEVGAGVKGVMRVGIQDSGTGAVGTVRVRFGGR